MIGFARHLRLIDKVGVIAQVKRGRVGLALALAPDTNDGGMFRTNFPARLSRADFPARLSRADFPPGRGLFVAAGKTAIVQVGLVEEA